MIFKDMERIVFAGDSVTDAGRVKPLGEGLFDSLGQGYVRIFENLMCACYPELRLRVTNAGVGGNTSNDLLSRFNSDVVDLNPDWVSICIGINDVWRQFDCPAIIDAQVDIEDYKNNVEQMILSIKDKVKGVFICTPYYMEPNRNDAMRVRMDEYSDACRELAKKYGCILIDFQAMFDKYLTIRHSACIGWDRVHPNGMAATLMAREFLKYCEFDYNREL